MTKSCNYNSNAYHVEQLVLIAKRNTCIHEAGHAVAAIAVGASGVKAVIEKNEDAAPDQKVWGGYAQCDNSPLSKAREAVIGISGVMANWYADLGSDRCFWYEMCDDFVHLVDDGWCVPSATDYEALGASWAEHGYKIASMAGKILSKHWQAVESTALWLSSKEFIMDGQIRMLMMDPGVDLETIPFEALPKSPEVIAFEKSLSLCA